MQKSLKYSRFLIWMNRSYKPKKPIIKNAEIPVINPKAIPIIANNFFSFFFHKAIAPIIIEIETLITNKHNPVSVNSLGIREDRKERVMTIDKIPDPKDV